MNLSALDYSLAVAGAAGVAIAIGCYIWGFVIRPTAFRPFHCIALFCGLTSIGQAVRGFLDPADSHAALGYAVGLGTIALLAQSLTAIRRRPGEDERAR